MHEPSQAGRDHSHDHAHEGMSILMSMATRIRTTILMAIPTAGTGTFIRR